MALNLALGAALTGLGALSGLFGKKKQVSDTSWNNLSAPEYDPKNLGFRDFLIDMFQKRLGGSPEFEQAYKINGLKNLNRTSQSAQGAIDSMLTARGLGQTTGGVSSLRDVSLHNADKTADFLNSVPLIMDQRQFDTLGAAGAYQAGLPVGTRSSGTQHTEGTAPGPSGFSGAITGGASGLAGFLGQYYANKQFGDILKQIPVNTPVQPPR